MNDPVPDLIIIAVKNFYIHFRIIFPEKMNHIRHPQSSDAGKTTDPQFPLNLIVDIEGGLAQLVFLVDHFLNVRDEAGTVVSEADTPFNPGKKLHTQFFLQSRHHLADAGLGIIQCFRRLGEASRFTYF